MCVFDSLTHSAFSENYLGVRNPAADYLSNAGFFSRM